MAGMITEKTVKNIIGRRKKEIHKGDCGRILIAAGSEGMAGAAILAARSALRAGSGLVRTAIPKELFPIVQVGVPEATCVERRLPIPNLELYDAVCTGPGLGESSESIEFVKELLKNCEKTLVLDADALNIIAHNDLFKLLRMRAERFPKSTVLTPHMGEAKRLLGGLYEQAVAPPDCTARKAEACGSGQACSTAAAAVQAVQSATARSASESEPRCALSCESAYEAQTALSQAARLRIAEALVKKTRAVTVLKGAGTIVAAEDCEAYTNTTGNPGMATAGSGDVLSGIITAFAGQKRQQTAYCELEGTVLDSCKAYDGERITAFEAAICGVYIHGLAGDLAARKLGEYGVTAGDIALYTAYALKTIAE